MGWTHEEEIVKALHDARDALSADSGDKTP
jgi:hypothetical protein